MVEIYNKLKVLSYEKNELEILHNPQSINGCTISDAHRLLYFVSANPATIFVDFLPQPCSPGALIFIPAHQLLYFPETDNACDVYCIYIPACCLSDIQHVYLLRRVYEKIKTIRTGSIDPGNFDLDKLFNPLLQADHLLMQSLPSLQYVDKAVRLMHILRATQVDFQLKINTLADAIHVSGKTLFRITKSVLNVSPSDLLNYYIQLKIVFRIITRKLHTFFDIAAELNCSDVSSFGRYVKSLSGLTPKELRNKFYRLQL